MERIKGRKEEKQAAGKKEGKERRKVSAKTYILHHYRKQTAYKNIYRYMNTITQ